MITESKIEIIEKYHSNVSDNKGLPQHIDKIERIIVWDGEEIYKEISDPKRKSNSFLQRFLDVIIYKKEFTELNIKIDRDFINKAVSNAIKDSLVYNKELIKDMVVRSINAVNKVVE